MSFLASTSVRPLACCRLIMRYPCGRVAAVPPDVRKGFAFQKGFFEFSLGYALRAEPRCKFSYVGKPEAFRTSGGEAAKHAGGVCTGEHFEVCFSLIKVGPRNQAQA